MDGILERSKQIVGKGMLFRVLLIFLCFFLTSTGYLAWLYHLLDLAPAGMPDLLAMGLGYGCQAAGIGAFALIASRRHTWVSRRTFTGALIAYLICMIPAAVLPGLPGTAVFGALLNLFCGVIVGFYLHDLGRAEARVRGRVFGLGYGIATAASWILSRIANITVWKTNMVIVFCAALTAVTVLLLHTAPLYEWSEEGLFSPSASADMPQLKRLLIIACAVVFLFSVVNHVGFSFPASDIGNGVDLELSRLFYAAGLVIAGLVNDKNRKYGAITTMGALVIPFIMLSLGSGGAPAAILWALSYFASGFFSVYRIILFVDLAEAKRLPFLAGFGLLFGRLGEALGTVLYSAAAGRMFALVMFAALLYIATILLFFWLWQKIYLPEADRERSEREAFRRFAVKHDLSPREREIMSLLLEKETTAAIAEQLFVSESTVKFHIHNLLQKTGTKNRKELVEQYYSGR